MSQPERSPILDAHGNPVPSDDEPMVQPRVTCPRCGGGEKFLERTMGGTYCKNPNCRWMEMD